MLKLGVMIMDMPTNIKGMLVIYQHDMSGNEHYLFQPAGLNPKTQQPLDTFWIGAKRVGGVELDKKFWISDKRYSPVETDDVKLPTHVLNTLVEDKATGFKGIAIAMYYHLNGCIHVEVKPSGTLSETGECIGAKEFDLRRLKGEAIVELNEEELKKSKIEAPSPEGNKSFDVRTGH